MSLSKLDVFPAHQSQRRAQLYTAFQKTRDQYWDEAGQFLWKNPKAHGGFRGMLWQCLAYLMGDERSVERANQIILTHFTEKPDHFTPGAVCDVLYHSREKLWPEVETRLVRYLKLNVPFMGTEDLKIHGYNDNHPYKAMHTLIVGGEILESPFYVGRGLLRLRQAIEIFERNGFPCEYNSPNYTPVSLQPLASIVEQTENEEARELALRLERFYWRDVALHFDGRAGLPTGPMSRAGVHDYDGQLSNLLCLLLHLFPERFAIDLTAELIEKGEKSRYISAGNADGLPFYQSHPIWFARPEYHLTPELESLIFAQKTGVTVRGSTESGTWALSWPDEKRPLEAPKTHHSGPRRSVLTTFYGENFTLGSAEQSWLDNGQSHGFYATISNALQGDGKLDPARSVSYFSRCFFDENYPYAPASQSTALFREQGDIRTLQHENTALVFYNPLPLERCFRQIRSGIFRPLIYSQPKQLYVGETSVPTFNFLNETLEIIAIDEGEVYVGIVPMCLTQSEQARKANLQIHTYGDHLSILFSSSELWNPTDHAYEAIIETHAGFAFEIHRANKFESFTAFRQWLGQIEIEDDYYALMRTTTYRQSGVTLSSCYSPFQGGFRHTTVNGAPLDLPILQSDGLKVPEL